MLGVPWTPIRTILLSALRSLLPPPRKTTSVPVFMMLPLDAASPSPTIPMQRLENNFARLKRLGATGVMLDVWWGHCEPSPGDYDFSRYLTLLRSVKNAGLVAQAVMSFHSCGGNVGDSVSIPLPEWVVKAGDDAGGWFQDRSGYASREYLSFGVDHHSFLPGLTGTRTPVLAYTEFVAAFVQAVLKDGLEGVLAELQVGLGPCGELRYPSYPLADGKWAFPGIGEFQCFDKHLARSLARARAGAGEDVGAVPMPPDAGSYNDNPWATRFFSRGRKTPAGRFFLDWYSGELLRHGETVLAGVRAVTDVQLAVKVSGVHWWFHHSSRAAESTSGYISGAGSTYPAIAALCARHAAILDFTCLEMRSVDQPLWARCGPRQLVREVFAAADAAGVRVSGENAIERWDRRAFRQVAKAFRRTPARAAGYTHLRLSDGITEEGWHNFERFVRRMNAI